MTREEFIFEIENRQRALRRFLLGLCCGDTFLADDIAQETFIKAYLSLDTLKNPETFQSWIFSIGYRTFLDFKRRNVLTVDTCSARDLAADDTADKAFRYQGLYCALSQLSEKERTAILLYYMENYSTTDIASFIGVSAQAVRQLLSRGRSHLHNILISQKL